MKTILEVIGEFKDRMSFMKIIPEVTSPESAITWSRD